MADAWHALPALTVLNRAKAHAAGGADVCFVIHRSSNDNTVVYRGDASEGVRVFWIMFEQSGEPTEELTSLEKNTAYGTTIKPRGNGEFEIKLSALKDKLIVVREEDGRWCARTTIDGSEMMKLDAVHVEMVKGAWIPSVAYVELLGEGCYEVIEKVKGSGRAAKERALGLLRSAEGTLSPLHPISNSNSNGTPIPASAMDEDDDEFQDARERRDSIISNSPGERERRESVYYDAREERSASMISERDALSHLAPESERPVQRRGSNGAACCSCYSCVSPSLLVDLLCCTSLCFVPRRASWNRSFQSSVDALRTHAGAEVFGGVCCHPRGMGGTRVGGAGGAHKREAVSALLPEGEVDGVSLPPCWCAHPTLSAHGSQLGQAHAVVMRLLFGSEHPSVHASKAGKAQTRRMEQAAASSERGAPLRCHQTFILYLGGGGFIAPVSSAALVRDTMHRLVGVTGSFVIAPEVRRSPHNPWSESVQDCMRVYEWLARRVYNPRDQIFFCGDSAGGGLCSSLLLAIAANTHRTAADTPALPCPAGAILVSPWVDFDDTDTDANTAGDDAAFDLDVVDVDAIASFGRSLALGGADISPTDGELALLKDVPMLVIAGECEVLRPQIARFARKLKAAGAPVWLYLARDMVHAYWHLAFSGMHEPLALFDRVAAFIHDATRGMPHDHATGYETLIPLATSPGGYGGEGGGVGDGHGHGHGSTAITGQTKIVVDRRGNVDEDASYQARVSDGGRIHLQRLSKQAAPLDQGTGAGAAAGAEAGAEAEAEARKTGGPGWRALPALTVLNRAKAHAAGGADVCFVIHRSSNDNTVVYRGDASEGVRVFWIMFEQSGEPTEELTSLEKNTAYGTTIKPRGNGEFEIKLSALKDKLIVVREEDGRWCARTTIDGSEMMKLDAVHVEMVKGAWIPSVAYVELLGEGCYEVIEKVKGSGRAAKERALGLLAE